MGQLIEFTIAENERFYLHELPRARRVNDHTLESTCLHNGSDNPRALQIDLRKGLAHCFTKCNGAGWNQITWAKHWHGLSDREALQYVLLHSGHPDGRNILTWNVPLARPLSVTTEDFSLGILAQDIERAVKRVSAIVSERG